MAAMGTSGRAETPRGWQNVGQIINQIAKCPSEQDGEGEIEHVLELYAK